MIKEYFASIRALVRHTALGQPARILYDRRDKETGFLRGDLVFKDGSRLHFREFVRVKRGLPNNRYMYVFNYMRTDGAIIFRYDDTEHFPHLATAPHHKHLGENEVVAANPPDLQSVLKEIEELLNA
jgi:hypothetical protein